MFKGKYQNSIDTKSRMIVPSKFRDELGLKCVLTKGIDKCLYVYTTAEWEKFADKLSKLPVSDPKARAFVRHFNASAVDCEVDKQGRITLPQELREYAGIEKEMITIGNLNKIEIWDRNDYEETELDQEDIAEGMEAYGI